MSKADSVFGPLAGPLVQEWGSTCKFVKVNDPGTYNPQTGKVTNTETEFNVKAVMLELEPQEYEGVFQQSDFKLIIDPGQVGGGYITTLTSSCPLPVGRQDLQGDRRGDLQGR